MYRVKSIRTVLYYMTADQEILHELEMALRELYETLEDGARIPIKGMRGVFLTKRVYWKPLLEVEIRPMGFTSDRTILEPEVCFTGIEGYVVRRAVENYDVVTVSKYDLEALKAELVKQIEDYTMRIRALKQIVRALSDKRLPILLDLLETINPKDFYGPQEEQPE